ncbi:putative nuclease HARBI1 [Merluccius polli]|uniref:Putative nuclease HARBI1 n=1 Tax=Merluccius polli TaxID=89951 RepID=A0AA47N6T0_MERPO|nr:putative nuclease HARBI1 [Merluccius polli]
MTPSADGVYFTKNVDHQPPLVCTEGRLELLLVEIAGFPNVIGAIDCTHIAIKAPSEGEYAYVNRKHFHSLNVQIICDAQMRLTNIVARWPGSTHDSFVLTNSSVGNRLEPGIVERAIGQLKSRWRCLDRSGGVLLYHPEKVCRIVQACGVLHNIAHRHGVPSHEVMAPDDPDPGPNNAQPNAEAIRTRQQLIARI